MRLSSRSGRGVSIAMWVGLATVVPAGVPDDGQDGNSPRPFVIALDGKTGEELWRNDSARSGVRRVLGETRTLVFAYDADCSRISTRGSIVAFDRETGEERWRRRVSLDPGLYPESQFGAGYKPTQFGGGGNTIVVFDRGGVLQALRPTTGEVQWERLTDGRLPVAENAETIVLTSQPELLDPEARNPPDQVRAIDRATGEVRWSYRREDLGPLTRIETAMVGSDTAIVTFETDPPGGGVTVALDVDRGEERARLRSSVSRVP